MLKNHIKTTILLAVLTGILLWVGSLFGTSGLIIALIISLVINFGSYWFSDKIVLKMYKAKSASKKEFKELYKMVEEISKNASLPLPKLYIIPTKTPNAFATGRSPKHSSVAVTEGILDLLNEKELKGVISHEISHIKHRDTLIQTIAVSIAGVISYIAMITRWFAIFGGDDEGSLLELLVLAIITPIIATLIQLSISRSREYLADESGARLIKDGTSLANALEKLEKGNKSTPLKTNANATSSLFIINPFKARGLMNLLSTHPPVEERIKKLKDFKFED